MYNDEITLIKDEIIQDEIGNSVKKETKRNLFANMKSIGRNEFYQAAVSGMKPEAKFVIADYLDYQGERTLEYSGYGDAKAQRYSIIRTYRMGNELELTCRKEVGA